MRILLNFHVNYKSWLSLMLKITFDLDEKDDYLVC